MLTENTLLLDPEAVQRPYIFAVVLSTLGFVTLRLCSLPWLVFIFYKADQHKPSMKHVYTPVKSGPMHDLNVVQFIHGVQGCHTIAFFKSKYP